jgi:hypothetical protein
VPKSSRWIELFTETDRTERVDFHSSRRAFAGALDWTSSDHTKEAVDLTGHSGIEVHRRYIRHLATVAREIPPEVLPTFDIIPDGYRAAFAIKRLPWSLVDERAGEPEENSEVLTDEDLADDLGRRRRLRRTGKNTGKNPPDVGGL